MKTKFIYTLSDPRNNIVRYIGKTNDLTKRLRSHIRNNQLSSKTRKNNWIISLLRENILPKIEILDEVDEKDIDFFEIFYISLFKSWGFNLLNVTKGGDGFDWTGRKHTELSKLKNKINSPNRKSVAQYDLNDNFIKQYHSLREAALAVNGGRTHISRACRGILKTSSGFKWKFIDRISAFEFEKTNNRIEKIKKPRVIINIKKICVYDLEGNLMDICENISMTSKKFNCHRELIKKCCDKKGYYQTKNLTFRYEGDIFDYVPYKNYRPTKNYKIGIYSDENILIKSFDSLKEAVKYTGIGKQYISKVCKENGESGVKKLKNIIFRFNN